MRLSSWRGMLAALVGVTLLSCVDSMTGPSARPTGLPGANVEGIPAVVISQIYGGGGNGGATLKNDFIELFNPGGLPVNVTGWSVQYAAAAGTTWQVTALTGTISPGGYYLVQEGQGAGGTTALPTPDASGTIAMGATAGKVSVVTTTTLLTGACPTGFVDQVSFGTTATDCGFKTTGTLANATAAIRGDQGCAYTRDLSVDFAVAAPSPRNSSSPTHTCGVVVPPTIGPLHHIVITGSTSVGVGSTISLTAELQDAANHTITDPAATFAWVSADDATAHVVEPGTGNPVTIRGLQPGGPIAITVTATSNGVPTSATTPSPFTVTVAAAGTIVTSTTFVSEIHYDNNLVDVGEAIEIEGDANTSLDGWSLVLYNGNGGTSYNTTPLSGLIPPTCVLRGVIVVHFPDTPAGTIQNGSPDGWALVNPLGQVTEFNSYEGTFAATAGPAAGLTSTDVGVAEPGDAPIGRSLQRAGSGVWFGPRTSTFGACNPAQALGAQGGVLVTSGKTDFALAMQTQFFMGGNDASGHPWPNGSAVWSTSNSSIIIVDQDGVVTGKGVGTAQLIATAPDGSTGSVDVSIHIADATGSAGDRLGHNTEFGEPTDADQSDDFLIHRKQYTVSYNKGHGGANWVSWNLDASHVTQTVVRCAGTCYSADTALSNANITAFTTADWVSNVNGVVGYDRGHMAPSADWTSSEADNITTFFLSNFLPQRSALNSGPWEDLENALRDSVSVAHGSREAYIIAGGVFANGGDGLGSLLGKGKVFIPNSTYKIAVITPAGTGLNSDGTLPPNTTVMAVNMPNIIEIQADWHVYLTTVAEIEHETGYNFLALITESVQCRVEIRNCAPTARIRSRINGQAKEGQTVGFSGATSTDPDPSDVLNMVWTVNGVNAGTGPALMYTFANDGLYHVALTVTDNSGANSVASENVSVLNVAPTIGQFAGATLLRGETYTATGSFSDPGADSWTGTVNFGDSPATPSIQLTNKSFTLVHTYSTVGSFTVVVSVSDGTTTSAQGATVDVKSTIDGINDLSTAVEALPLNKGQLKSLQENLSKAIQRLEDDEDKSKRGKDDDKDKSKRDKDGDKGRPDHAVRELEEFIREIQAGMRSGRINAVVGSEIVAYAQRVIASITAP